MKPLALLTLLALAAPPAAAGDLSFGLGFESGPRGEGVRVRIGYKDRHRDRHRHHRGRHHRPRAPVVHCDRTWVPGHYDSVECRVWVPARHDRIWHPAEYGWRYDRSCGRRVRVVVRAGYYETIHVPGHYETRIDRVWVPGHYEYTCHHHHHRHRH